MNDKPEQPKQPSLHEVWKQTYHGSTGQYRPELHTAPPSTLSNAPLEPLYTQTDIDPKQLDREAFPGEPPFLRGIHPGMYRQRLWTFRQYAGFGSASETNARFKHLLAAGQTGLSVAFDLPTQLGMDPDDKRALGEVGRVGVSIASVDEMKRLFDGLDLGQLSTSMTINAPAAVLLAFYQVAAEESGVAPSRLKGTVQNDILKEYAARNNYIFPPQPSMRLTVDVLQHCAETLTGFYPLSISGYHLREAGCTATQEIAFTLANGLAYVEAAVQRGLDPNRIGQQLSFFFAAATDLLEEIAKFRCARRLWAQLLKEQFQVTEPKALQLRFHVQTAGSLLTSQQPENNLVRVTLQALAAVLGGCQSLHTNAYDEALGLPGEHSARLALATQQVLAYETGITSTVDPVGGSYAIEALTDRLEAESRQLLDEIASRGGAVEAVRQGFYQRAIAQAAFAYQRSVEQGTRQVVGVNVFTNEGAEGESSIQRLNPAIETEAVARVQALKTSRDQTKAQQALLSVEAAARSNENQMPSILQAARARCTVGEICAALKKVHGEYRGMVHQ